MLASFIQLILLLFIILTLIMLAGRLKIAYPIVLCIGGLLLSTVHVLPAIQINPELILLIFMPPLLYEAAWYTSWKDFWRWRRMIISFAFLIVIVTSCLVAVVSVAIIPGFTLALGFLLGGIVSPPDAVSATTVLKYVKVPKAISAILEGESLMNDASSLIIFRFALVAVTTGQFVFLQAAGSFVLVIVMGIVVGLAVAVVYYIVHRWMPTTTQMDIVLTFTAPYVMYIIAEQLHGSGVLAVVTGGLFLSSRQHLFLSNRSRIAGADVWATVTYMLNGLVFVMIGLELPVIIKGLGKTNIFHAITYGLIISFALIVGRILCTLGTSIFTTFISNFITTAQRHPGWKGPLIIGWAGMRGVVSLAAALSIPVYVSKGVFFPERNLILFITFMVILVTLVLQGLTLPLIVRWLKMEDFDHALPLEEQEVKVRKQLLQRSMKFLDEQHAELQQSNRAVRQMREELEELHLLTSKPAATATEREQYLRVSLQLLEFQREVLHELNKDYATNHEVIRKFYELLDVEEEKLRLQFRM
ncbi:Na+/H+ antiporter [Chitinophaga sp. Cy-1792]|uniref:Na+/H+ antiporter n=1 Tax=Chitinophaga sp. Cy-1792 TaxID=2608339 RepID=UPI00141F877F|nr:Na+/H+ antiporter [Chitinophaga sp. Cy-1792]NIG54153.1 Na+/H+ antiporter [Chitinophaga sp. Cy-1792]